MYFFNFWWIARRYITSNYCSKYSDNINLSKKKTRNILKTTSSVRSVKWDIFKGTCYVLVLYVKHLCSAEIDYFLQSGDLYNSWSNLRCVVTFTTHNTWKAIMLNLLSVHHLSMHIYHTFFSLSYSVNCSYATCRAAPFAT